MRDINSFNEDNSILELTVLASLSLPLARCGAAMNLLLFIETIVLRKTNKLAVGVNKNKFNSIKMYSGLASFVLE